MRAIAPPVAVLPQRIASKLRFQRDGVYRQRLDLASGRFAMIDDALGFNLVPRTPSLARHLSREVLGLARTGRIEWTFARSRGPGIG